MACVCCLLITWPICGKHGTFPCYPMSTPLSLGKHAEKEGCMGTRGTWANNFLRQLGNQVPQPNMVRFVAAWTKVENTKARYNPLATTQPYGNSEDFNDHHVQSYATYDDGVKASIETISQNHFGYAELKDALIHNDVARALASAGLDTWGSHSGAVAAAYAAGDWRDEDLLSDEGTPEGTPVEKYSEADPTHGGSVTIKAPSSTVTEEDVRNVAKQLLGVLLIASGVVVIAVAILKSDEAQTALTTAAKAAL